MVSRLAFLIILLLRISTASETADHSEIEHFSDGPFNQITIATTPETISPMTSVSSSPEVSGQLILERSRLFSSDSIESRPRKSSFNSHSTPRKALHVSFGWVQFSDDRWMPSDDMEDTKENREHIKALMLTDARRGNLEYFRDLANVLNNLNAKDPKTDADELQGTESEFELNIYNPESFIVAAVHSDNVELFIEVMKFKGITISDLNPCKIKIPKTKRPASSYPPRIKSFFDSDDSSNDGDDKEDHVTCLQIEETILGQVILHNSISILRYLLDQGIKDNYPESSETALHYAIQCNHELIVRLLLTSGNSLIDRCNGAFQSPLMTAVLTGNPKMVQVVLSHNPNLLMTDFNRCNVLHLAAHVGNMDTLKYLKEAGDRLIVSVYERNEWINDQDLKKNSILHYAASAEVYRFLVEGFGAVEGVKNSSRELAHYSNVRILKIKK